MNTKNDNRNIINAWLEDRYCLPKTFIVISVIIVIGLFFIVGCILLWQKIVCHNDNSCSEEIEKNLEIFSIILLLIGIIGYMSLFCVLFYLCFCAICCNY